MGSSYDSFIRLVTSQIVSRVIATLAQSFREATTAARDLEITIARIQTLDEGLRLRSIDSLSNQLQTLSGQFAQPIEDLAAGLYDTISNQVGSAADSVNVLTEALRLQLLVGGEVSSNVDLLSSVINAYSIAANRASVITDKLFAGIDLGRVTAEELGNRFGRVATQGAQLGVSLDELVGTIAAATINGIKGSEALTQLGQEIVSLTKPSTAMSEALKAAGISSVELAVSTTSLADVLKRVIATTDGTQESIARLFPNIRAARLALARLSDTGNVFESTIAAVGERVGATADEMENLIRNTNAFKLNQEFEKFQAILTSEGARAFNESLLGLIQSLGGAENAGRLAAESFKLIIPVGIAGTIGITAVIFGKLTTSIKAAATAAIGAKAAFAALFAGAGVLASIAITSLIGTYAELNSASDKLRGEINKLRADFDALSKTNIRAAEVATKIQVESTNRQIAALSKLLGATRSSASERARISTQIETQITSGLLSQVEERIGILDSFAKQSAAIEEAAGRRIQQLQTERFQTELQASQEAFQRSLEGRDDKEIEQRLRARIKKLLESARKAISTGQFDVAEALLGQSDTLAQRSADLTKNERATNAVLQARLSLNDALVEQELKKVAEAKAAAKIAAENAFAIRDQVSALEEQLAKLKELREQGRTGDDFNKTAENIRGLSKALDELLVQGGADLSSILSIPDFVRKAEALRQPILDTLTAQPVTLEFAIGNSIEALRGQVENVFNDLKLNDTQRSAVANALGLDPNGANLAQTETALKNLRDEIERLTGESNAAEAALKGLPQAADAEFLRASTTATKEFSDALQNLILLSNSPIGSIQRLFGGGDAVTGADAAVQLEKFKTLLTDIKAAAESGDQTALANLTAQLAKVRDTFAQIDTGGFTGAVEGLTDFSELGDQLFDSVVRLQDALKAEEGVNTFKTQLQDAQGRLQILTDTIPGFVEALLRVHTESQKSSTGLKDISSEGQKIGPAVSGGAAQASAALAALQARAIAAANAIRQANAAAASGPGNSNGRAANGRIGTDSIGTLTGPGEAIINRADSARFAGTLRAINSGFGPSRFANGGVTNVGDIHVNVSSGEASPVTGRQVANELRRELRRKTSRLN